MTKISHMKDLSDTQQAILAFLRERIGRDGMPPSQLEICAAFGFRQNATAAYHLRALEAAGMIERLPHKARGLRLANGSRPRGGSHRGRTEQLALPVLGRVAAGLPIGADIGSDEQLLLDRHCFDPLPDYLLRVQGDSMRATTMRPSGASGARFTATRSPSRMPSSRIESPCTRNR